MSTKISELRKGIDKTMKQVNLEISDLARNSHVAAGLASEGYAGGYRDALSDVLLALNGVNNGSSRYWRGGT
jgi:hypothetical protein